MKEHDIRPRELFDAYLAVARADIAVFFADTASFVAVPCPGCNSRRTTAAFTKHGMHYRTCDECRSLFMSPRPTREAIDRYYRESASSQFWAERFFPETAEPRRLQIFRPRAELVGQLLRRFDLPMPVVMADIGSGFGLFLEEMARVGGCDDIVGIEPSRALAVTSRQKGFRVLEAPVEALTAADLQASVLTSFEVFEHLFAPIDLLEAARRVLVPGGLVFLTTLTCSGWDMQVLWEHSKSISPPHHINLLTTEGLEAIVSRAGLELVEIATPGQLDVDIVDNMLAEDSTLVLPRFTEYMLRRRGAETRKAFQRFLQEHNLSSHVRIVARKPGTSVGADHPQSQRLSIR